MQYRNVRLTPASGDQGADVIAESLDGKRTVIQAKKWQGSVGNSAIQEVLGAMLYYDANDAFVITTSFFTDSAKALAKKDVRKQPHNASIPFGIGSINWQSANMGSRKTLPVRRCAGASA